MFARGGASFEQTRANGIGHVTRVFGTAPVSAKEGAARVAAVQREIVEETRLGIPAIVHEECLTGFTTYGATVYPTSLAWAATFYLHPPLGGDNEGTSNLDPTPLFPFGHGISYTRYEYSDLRLSAPEIPTDGQVSVSVQVANAGDRAGEEIVQLYLHDVCAQVTRPVLELAGFARVALAPGERARVTFALHADRTSFTGLNLRRIVEPGRSRCSPGRPPVTCPARLRSS